MGGQEVGSGLGPRGVCRARLVGRLAAPRGDLDPARPLGEGPEGKSRSPSSTTKPAAALKARLKDEIRTQHLRPGDGRPDGLADRAAAIEAVGRTLRRRCSAMTRR